MRRPVAKSLLVLVALLLPAGLLIPAVPATSAVPVPSLSVVPSSGPVGTVVTVNLSGPCGSVVFESANGSSENSALDFAGSQRALVPSFIGAGPAQMVGPGRYQFAVSCSTGTGPSSFTTVTTPFMVTGGVTPGGFVAISRTPDGGGYWLAQANGAVWSFGDASFHGSLPGLGIAPAAPIVGIAATHDGGGYWLVASDGGVFAFGDAVFHGSLPSLHLVPAAPIVGIAATHDGNGYWLDGADSGAFAFGSAPYCTVPVVSSVPATPPGFVSGRVWDIGIAAQPDTAGFYQVSSGGPGVAFPGPGQPCGGGPPFTNYGDISFFAATSIAAQISGVATPVSGKGVWIVGIDGGVFAPIVLGENQTNSSAPFFGSLPGLGIAPAAPIVGIASTPDGGGYWLLGADGGVFSFGNARFHGSAVS